MQSTRGMSNQIKSSITLFVFASLQSSESEPCGFSLGETPRYRSLHSSQFTLRGAYYLPCVLSLAAACDSELQTSL